MATGVVVLMALSFVCGYVYRWRGVPFVGRWTTPFVGKRLEFAITATATDSPLDRDVMSRGPCLTRKSVTDVRANGVADPFLYSDGHTWHMFMEVVNRRRNRGEIGLAVSADGIDWQYQGIVLREPFHLSYPHVVEDATGIYMIPETRSRRAVRLYKAVEFPRQWRFEQTLLEGRDFTDPTVFHDGRTWWMFVSCMSSDLLLYYADSLRGPWSMHPESPIVYNDPSRARCGGRPFKRGDTWIRLAQDCSRIYGQELNAFEITTLNKEQYHERPLQETPVLEGTRAGWNAGGMHHLDVQPSNHGRYIVAADGWSEVRDFGIKY